MYFLHGWLLALNNRSAIDGRFQAWPYGPVEEELYHIFTQFRGSPIADYAKTWVGDEEKAFVVSKDDKIFYEVFDFVAQKYMPFTALQLSALTHQQDTPWSKARESDSSEISDAEIKSSFKRLISRSQQAA